MKLSAGCLVILLVVVMVLEESEASWLRRRCKWRCWRSCSGGRCSFRCGLRCSFGKRAADGVEHPFPAHFESYDDDSDGFVDAKEFAKALLANPNHPATKASFRAADRNADNKIDKEEFDAAPFEKYENDEEEFNDNFDE